MIKRFKNKLSEAQKQDEAARLSTATRWIIIIGIAIAVIWLFVILPIQLYMIRTLKSEPEDAGQEQVLIPSLPDLPEINPSE